ncbi:unnamed protein product [Absidia cylindrospora]
MMSNNSLPMEDDDVDDFLYGSDALEGNYGTTSKLATKKNKETEEDDEIMNNTTNFGQKCCCEIRLTGKGRKRG